MGSYREVLGHNPPANDKDLAAAHQALGRLFARSDPGKDGEAIEHYRAAIKLGVQGRSVHEALGDLLARRPETALQAMDEYGKAGRPDMAQRQRGIAEALEHKARGMKLYAAGQLEASR